MKKWPISRLFLSFFLLLNACTLGDHGKESSYDQTKEMVTDVLQTEDGKKVLKEVLRDERMKEELIIDTDEVKTTLEKALKSKESQAMWKHLFADPEFVQSFQTAFAEEHMHLLKKLMHDATFQAQLLDLLQNPEMDKQIASVIKSQASRSHLEKLMIETFQNPTIKHEIYQLIQQAIDQPRAKEEGGQTEEAKEETNKNEEADGTNEEE